MYKTVNGEQVELTPEEEAEWLAQQNAPLPVPISITPRQLKLALLSAGKLDQIEEFVAALPPEQRAAQISWEYAVEFRRDDPMLNQMAGFLVPPISQEEIDALFIAAADIQ